MADTRAVSIKEDPDADLIRRIGRGDAPAFAALMDRHLSSIVAHAMRMTGSHAVAEDISQTVFLKIWQTAPNWKFGQARFSTWIRRVTTNLCIDRLRDQRISFLDQIPEMIDQAPDQENQIMTAEDESRIHQALLRLPERQRAAISLSYFDGASQKHGAEILGITESAYESLLVRARKTLRRDLVQKQALKLLDGGKT